VAGVVGGEDLAPNRQEADAIQLHATAHHCLRTEYAALQSAIVPDPCEVAEEAVFDGRVLA